MDVDNVEVDAQLLQQFSAMGTRDKEQLLEDLRNVIGNDVTLASCRFFLELANWNLQAAIGAYFDFGFENSPSAGNPSGTVVQVTNSYTTTSGDQLSVPRHQLDLRVHPSPADVVVPLRPIGCRHKWRVENCGRSAWPEGAHLRSVPRLSAMVGLQSGVNWWLPLCTTERRVPLPTLRPGDMTEVDVDVCPPPLGSPGIFAGALRAYDDEGGPFGEMLPCYVVVSDNGHVVLHSSLPSSPPIPQPWPSFPGPVSHVSCDDDVMEEVDRTAESLRECPQQTRQCPLLVGDAIEDDCDIAMEEL